MKTTLEIPKIEKNTVDNNTKPQDEAVSKAPESPNYIPKTYRYTGRHFPNFI